MKIFVAGDSGLLGQALVRRLAALPSNEVQGVSSSDFNPFKKAPGRFFAHRTIDLLKSEAQWRQMLEAWKPNLIVNAAALVDLHKCETDRVLADQLNAEFPGKLAKVARSLLADFVHISTDQVFDGRRANPYKETDSTSPLNEYGRGKLKAEQKVLAEYPEALILRTNIVGFRDRPGAQTFAEWLTDSLWNKKPITLFEDFITSSIHVGDFVDMTLKLVQKKSRGLFNVASRDAISKYSFGERLCRDLDADFSAVKKGRMSATPMQPPRPPYLALDVSKVEKELETQMPSSNATISKLAHDFNLRKNKEVSLG